MPACLHAGSQSQLQTRLHGQHDALYCIQVKQATLKGQLQDYKGKGPGQGKRGGGGGGGGGEVGGGAGKRTRFTPF